MTTLDILATVGQHLTDLNLPGVLAVLPPGDERIPEAGREKHPDKSLLIFEKPLNEADGDKRNQLQQKLPSMTVANVGIYVKVDNGKLNHEPQSKESSAAPSAAPAKTRTEVFMGEITAADLERKLDEGFTKWHADFKASKLHVVLVRQVAVTPTPEPEKAKAVKPTIRTVRPSLIIQPPVEPEPALAEMTLAEAYKTASNARIFEAGQSSYEDIMARSRSRWAQHNRPFVPSPLLKAPSHV